MVSGFREATHMKAFVFTVRHPELDPPEGSLEVIAPDFDEAIKQIAEKCPGIHVVRFEFEYDPDTIARA